MFKLFKKWAGTTAENEPFITLVRVAREDAGVREKLLDILCLDDFHRKSALNTLIEQLRYRRAPDVLLAALSALLDDGVAAKTLELIAPEVKGPPGTRRRPS